MARWWIPIKISHPHGQSGKNILENPLPGTSKISGSSKFHGDPKLLRVKFACLGCELAFTPHLSCSNHLRSPFSPVVDHAKIPLCYSKSCQTSTKNLESPQKIPKKSPKDLPISPETSLSPASFTGSTCARSRSKASALPSSWMIFSWLRFITHFIRHLFTIFLWENDGKCGKMTTILCRKYLEISWDLFGVLWEMWENVGNTPDGWNS